MESEIIENITINSTADSRLSNSYMFTEEQITKQLVDMKEQTDFMKKFRCALGIALHEIKTLRTTNSDNLKDSDARKRHASCSAITEMSTGNINLEGTVTSPPSDKGESSRTKINDKERCVCSELGEMDMAILKEYLGKMTLDDDFCNGQKHIVTEHTKSMHKTNVETLESTSTATEGAIRHIDRLKQIVLERNSMVAKLCKQLTQARLIRVKRETKLEQKIIETRDLKAKCEKMRKANDKQVKITKGLRLALNAERQKVKSSENLVISLDHTRRAFESLKSQAGQLMHTLREKDNEIASLTAKLTEIESNKEPYLEIKEQLTSRPDVTSQIHGVIKPTPGKIPKTTSCCQTDKISCQECEKYQKDFQDLQEKYKNVSNAFEDYRKVFRPPVLPQRSLTGQRVFDPPREGGRELVHRPNVLPHNHPYGDRRGRMHAPYTSLDSYRRVSRPPLRRRLQYEINALGNLPTRPTAKPDHFHMDGILSPIDENEESSNSETKNVESGQNVAKTHYSEVKHAFNINESNSVISTSTESFAEKSFHEYADSRTSPNLYSKSLTSTPVEDSFHEVTQTTSRDSSNLFHASTYDEGQHVCNHSLNILINSQKRDDYRYLTNHEQLTTDSQLNSEISRESDTSSIQIKTADDTSINQQKFSNSQKSSIQTHEKSPSRNSPNPTLKTSYLELGTSATPSPSNSVKSGTDLELQEPTLCPNSFIRYNEPEKRTGQTAEQSIEKFDDFEHEQRTGDVINECGSMLLEKTPMEFGVLWHPALIKTKPCKEVNEYDNATFIDKMSGNYVTDSNVIAHKSRKTSRCVHYKGHKIDVTKFSIHVFRDIVWSLDGESADDFIRFLASLAKKLNASPKWAGKHALGDPSDWLALRGLY